MYPPVRPNRALPRCTSWWQARSFRPSFQRIAPLASLFAIGHEFLGHRAQLIAQRDEGGPGWGARPPSMIRYYLSLTDRRSTMTATIARPMSVKLDPDTRARLEHLAVSRRRTPHWMLREAVAQYVEREEKREAFRQDTLKAWEEYRTTG